MEREKIKSIIEAKKDSVIELWEKLVNIDSGTYDIEGVNKVASVFEEKLKSLGCETKIYKFENAGNTLIATLNPDVKAEPILFIGHMDTVFSSQDSKERPFKIEEGKAYGPGVLDMKAGDVIAVFTLEVLKEIGYNKRPIKIIFSGDEELAHINSTGDEVIYKEAIGAKAALNFETGRVDEGIVVGRMGTRGYDVSIEGVSAHSGNNPDLGRSAILEAARKIVELEGLNDIPRGKLVNCGLVNGGVSNNTIPGNCTIGILTRYVSQEIGDEINREVEEILNQTFVEGTKTTFVATKGIPSMERTPGVIELYDLVENVAVELGFPKPHPVEVGGGSDSAFTVSAGIPTVCAMGAKGEFNHTDREYAVVDSMFERIELAANTVLAID